MAERTVSVKLKADVAAYMAEMRAAGRATSDLEKVSRELRTALRDEEDAAGRVKVAQAALNDLQNSGKASAAQLAQAEEKLAKTQRDRGASADRLSAAQRQLMNLQESGNATAAQLAQAQTRLAKAEADDANAAGRLRVAQAQLDEVRKGSKASLVQLAKAEEDLANAHRKLEAAQERTSVSQAKFNEAQEKVGADAGDAFGRGYERETSKVAQRANAQFSAMMAAGLAAGGGAAAGAGALISAAAIAGTTAAILGIGVAALKSDQDVVTAFSSMKSSVASDAAAMAAPLKGPLIQSIGRVKAEFHDMAPALQADVAATVPALDHLTSGVINMGRAAIPGISALASTSDSTFRGVQHLLEGTGAGFTDFATRVSGESHAVEADLDILAHLVASVLGSVGGVVANLAGNTRGVAVFSELVQEAAHTLELLTANGGAAMSMLTGFGGTAVGLLHILNGVLQLLNMLPSGVSEFIGMLAAGMVLANKFGFSVKDAFTQGGSSAEGFRGKVGATIAILAAVGAAAHLMASEVQRGQTTTDGLSTSLARWNSTGQASGDLAKLFGGNLKDMNDAFTILNEKGLSKGVEGLTDFVGNLIGVDSRLDDAKSRVGQLDEALASMVRNNQGAEAAQVLQRVAQQTGMSVEDLKKLLPGYTAAQNEAAAGTKNTATSVKDLGEQAKTSAAHVQALLDSINNLVQPELDARGAARELQKAIDDATGAVKENGRNLDITTEKGRNNQEALDGIASSTNGLVQALVKSGGSQRDVAAAMDQGRNAFINSATAMGMSKTQAEQLATQLGLMSSKDYDVVMGANVQGATDKVNNFLAFADAQSATAKVFGDTGPALGAVKDWQNVTQHTDGNTTTYSYTDPATGAVTSWKIMTDATGARTTVYSFTDPATGKVYEWKRLADGTWGTVNVGVAGVAQANATIDRVARDRAVTLYLQAVAAGPGRGANPGNLTGIPATKATGGVVMPMAAGGALNPMEPIAQKVPPNTWRVVGDNLSVPEYYIPANGSARSKRILAQAIADPRLGGLRMAGGGIVDAARELLDAYDRDVPFFEDFSFRGAGDLNRQYNDQIADAFYAANPGYDFGQAAPEPIRAFLENFIASQTAQAAPSVTAIPIQRAVQAAVKATIPAAQLAGARSVTQHFHFEKYIGSREEIINFIRNRVRDGGGNVQRVLGRG